MTARPRRVAMLTSVHRWNDVRIFVKQARSLAAAGHDVTVIAPGAPDETIEGVRMEGVPTPRNRLARMTVTPWHLLRRAWRHEICHVHDPELIPMSMLLRLAGRSTIYDVHENLPRDIEDKPWIPRPLRPLVAGLAGGLERLAGLVSTRIVAATSTIAGRFPAGRTVVIENFPLTGEFATTPARPYRERAADFAYVGGITEDRGIREMITAAGLLAGRGVRLVLAGPWSPPSLERDAGTLPGWAACTHLGVLDREGVGALLATARAGLIVLHPVANHADIRSHKFYEYMSAGLPVIAPDMPAWRETILAGGFGLVIDPTDPHAIAAAMAWMLDNPAEAEAMGARGRKAVATRLNWEREAGRLCAMYDAMP